MEKLHVSREQYAMAIADHEAKTLRVLESVAQTLALRRAMLKSRQCTTLALLLKTKRLEQRRQAFHVRLAWLSNECVAC